MGHEVHISFLISHDPVLLFGHEHENEDEDGGDEYPESAVKLRPSGSAASQAPYDGE